MTKIALITDIHFGVRGDSQFFLDNYEKFFNHVFFPTLQQNNVKTVLCLGDTWEYRKKIDLNTLHRAKQMFFDRLCELDIKVHIIYGNHDVFYKNTNEVNSIDFLGEIYPNVNVIKNHEVLTFNKLKIAMISWVNNSNYQDSMHFIATADAPILCGHFEIKGFEMMAGHICDDGFDRSVFDRYEAVYSGHFHVMSTDGRITYISNPSQTNWGDFGQTKGFRLLDVDTKEMTLIENPFDVYAKIWYNDDVDLLSTDFSEYDGKIVRVFIENFTKVNHNKLGLFLEQLNRHAHSAEVRESAELNFESEAAKGDMSDMQSLVNDYLDDVSKNNGQISLDNLRSYFMEVYREAVAQGDAE